ncbi:MAG: sulfatase [Bacteroidales bacterium]
MRITASLPLASVLLTLAFGLAGPGCTSSPPEKGPNILWITSEDNSAYFLGCYGNEFATTPNLDRLAGEGFRYTHAYAPSPVCNPARNAIITGMYAASNGNENMDSGYPTSDLIRTYAEILREAGYYCTNNSKTGYCSGSLGPDIWDESSTRAHYLNRPDGTPFFAVFNLFSSHESSNHRYTESSSLRHSPEMVEIAPYHPDIPAVRHDWAQYYDRIEDMDTEVGMLLQELEESGLADNTIVFYYSDHGGVLPRSKRFCDETGTQVPLIIRIPEKYRKLYPAGKPGETVDRLVNFVDLAPTLYSILGLPIPNYIQGNAFLGEKKTPDPAYTFMTRQRMDERFDNVRAVRDGKYRYIRNYMPHRIPMQHVDYLYLQPSARAWMEAFETGETNEVQSRAFRTKAVEELYDTEHDYWETNNLAGDPAYQDVLERMRKALDDWRLEIMDGGVIPETEYTALAGEASLYDYVRSEECPFGELITASNLAVLGGPVDLPAYVAYLKHENSAMRYWGATGLLLLEEHAAVAVEELKFASLDEAGAVAAIAAEALYRLGERDAATRAYAHIFEDGEHYELIDRYFALGSIDALGAVDPGLVDVVRNLSQRLEAEMANRPRAWQGTPSTYMSGAPDQVEKRAADTLSTTLGKVSTTFGQGVGIHDGVEPDPAYEFGLSYELRIARYLLRKWA